MPRATSSSTCEAPHEFDGEEAEAQRHRRVEPPFGEDDALEYHCALVGRVEDGTHAVEDEHRGHRKADHVGDMAQPRPGAEKDVEAHVLVTPQEPRRDEEGG